MKKYFGGPKLGPKLGFLPFSQGGIVSFPWYCSLGQCRAEITKKRFMAQIGAEMNFSIVMLSSIHSNLLVVI